MGCSQSIAQTAIQIEEAPFIQGQVHGTICYPLLERAGLVFMSQEPHS
jgi:hypothetical protein